jgi:hypothetical protein
MMEGNIGIAGIVSECGSLHGLIQDLGVVLGCQFGTADAEGLRIGESGRRGGLIVHTFTLFYYIAED